jgi:hypothetical protein
MDENKVYKRFRRAMKKCQPEWASTIIDRLRRMTTWEEHSVKAPLDRSKSVEASASTGALSTGIVFVIFGLFGMYTVSNTV